MKRKVLVNEVVSFCFDYDLFKSPVKAKEIKSSLNKKLEDVAFIENLINTIFIKAKKRKILRTQRIINLLLELEKLRLKLEDKY